MSGSAPAPRIRVRAEPARPLPRQHVSCSAPVAVTRPRFAAASARYRRRAGRGATRDPSAGAVPVRTPGRCSPSRCSGRAPRRAACRAVARPRERPRPAGRRPSGCSCWRPGSISSRWRCGCSSGAADNGWGDNSANGSFRNDSGASEAVCSDSDGATTGTGTGADAGRSVGGRSCGAGPSSEDGAAGTATGMGAQEGAGNGAAFPFNSGRGSSAPACSAPRSCATAWLATGTTGAFTEAGARQSR